VRGGARKVTGVISTAQALAPRNSSRIAINLVDDAVHISRMNTAQSVARRENFNCVRNFMRASLRRGRASAWLRPQKKFAEPIDFS
jgi:hypothetical protein